MKFAIKLMKEAEDDLEELFLDPSRHHILKAVNKTIDFMKTNIKHPSLHTHKFYGRTGPQNQQLFEAYVQNDTPGAYRILWYYGSGKGIITILTIIPHP